MKKKTTWLAGALAAALAAAPVAAAAAGGQGERAAAAEAAGGAPSAAATAAGQAAAAPSADTQGHWAREAIARWADAGILSGYPDGQFRPSRTITRAELAAVVNRLFGYSADGSAAAFSDVSASAWYAEALAAAREAGYYQGDGANKALPEAAVSRQDAAALLARAFGLQAADGAGTAGFSDSASIRAYARDAVEALRPALGGYPDGTFRPAGPLTRAEAAQLLDRLVAAYEGKPGTERAADADGHAIVNADGVKLKDMAIDGNLYLAPGIGDGDASLERVQVAGTTRIAGGGEHSIRVTDSALGETVVERKQGKVRLVLTGGTVRRLTVRGSALIELAGDARVEMLELSGRAELTVGGQARIGTLVVPQGGALVNGQAVSAGEYRWADGALAPLGAASPAPSAAPSATPGPTAAPTFVPTATPTPTPAQTATPTPTASPTATPTASPQTIDFVDRQATAETRSLFSYLNEIRGTGILFGQQHATTEGLSITERDGTQSDAKNAVGDYPAVFGWDTLSLEGHEKPGVQGDPIQSRDNLVAVMKKAYESGGVLTLSSHMPNFVTGGDFYDLRGNVVSTILPGGSNHGAYNEFLDLIADFALHLKDDGGKPIPVVFRPFHEQSGSWFWWGAAFTTKEEYKEIYRYTVEYLRDLKGVRNFLYAYSPGGGFGTDEARYLETYPGDDYVDLLGFDSYYNGEGQSWFDGVAVEAATVSRVADAKGKIAALTEFGYQKMKTSGNATPDFYTRLTAALQSDPDAKRMAYMLTWANFGDTSTYVPYPRAEGEPNEMLPDFIRFYEEPYTLFAREVRQAYERQTEAAEEKPFVHVASPTNQASVRTPSFKVRVRVQNAEGARVVMTADGMTQEQPLVLNPATGFYEADWQLDGRLNGTAAAVTVRAYAADGELLQEETKTVAVKIPEAPLGEYMFDEGLEGASSGGGWKADVGEAQQVQWNGGGALKLDVGGLDPAETWQEIKLQLNGAAAKLGLADMSQVRRVKLDAYIPLDFAAASGDEAKIQAFGMLPPDFEAKYGMGTTQVRLSELPTVTVGQQVYAHYAPEFDLTDLAKLQASQELFVSLAGSGLSGAGSVYIDRIGLYSTFVDASLDPASVDDFEGYMGQDAALQTKFVHAGGDSASAALDSSRKHGGGYGLKYTYTLGSSGYAGITKSMGGADWSDYNALQFWYEPDGKGQKLVMQINASGKTYEYYPDTTGTEPQLIVAPFRDFQPANGATGTLTRLNLKSVNAFSIYTNAVPDGNRLTSSMYFDDIRALNDPAAGTVPSGEGGAGLPKGVLQDFEQSLGGWAIGGNDIGLGAAALAADGGGQALAVTIGASPAAGKNGEIARVGALDLSSGSKLRLRARIEGGSASAQLFLKHGGGWSWAAAGGKPLTSEYQWYEIDLDGPDSYGKPIDKSFLQAIGLQVYDAAGGGTVYIDDVTLE